MKTSVLPVTDITIQFQFNAVWYANEPSITQYFFFNYIGGRFIEREEIKNGEEGQRLSAPQYAINVTTPFPYLPLKKNSGQLGREMRV